MNLSQSFICFIIYGFLGWLYESAFYTVQFKRPVNTGFLRGCFCPIYGLACVMNAWVLGNETRSWVIFLISMSMISVTEYMVSALLEYLFDKRWWDYSDWPCNLNGRISLFSSLGFGILSLMQLKFIHPFIMRFIEPLSDRVLAAAGVIFLVVMAADIIYSLRNMDKADEKLWFVDEEFEVIQRAEDRLQSARENVRLKYTYFKDKIKDRMGRM